MPQVVHIPKYLQSKETGRYVLDEDFSYFSERYQKTVELDKGYSSDGATGAFDIISAAWWVHDKLCEDMAWSDGESCTRWQGSMVCSDILKAEGRTVRSWGWRYATYLPKIWKDFKSKFNRR